MTVQQRQTTGKRLWSNQEDQLLRNVVAQVQIVKWAMVADEFNKRAASIKQGVKRTNKQCRQRWQNHLNPILQNSAEWSKEEHKKLLNVFTQHPHQWSTISGKLQQSGFPRRGDNHVKNYFYSSLKRAIKRINEVIRKCNKEIKKQKSLIYNYNAKYAYKKRLSLQRQILATSIQNEEHQGRYSEQPIIEEKGDTVDSNLRIIKQLDQEVVSKILLIAEAKGDKKYSVSNKKYEQEATLTRNSLIQYIKEGQSVTEQEVIALAIRILELSRRCKKKNNRDSDQQSQKTHKIEERKQISIQLLPQPALFEEECKKIYTNSQIKEQKKVQRLSSFNCLEQNNLLERFLIEEEDKATLSKKMNSSDQGSSIKLVDNPIFFNSPPDFSKICLQHSGSYHYTGNFYEGRDNNSFPFNCGVAFNNDRNDMNAPVNIFSPPPDLYKSQLMRSNPFISSNNQAGAPALSFINSMKEYKPEVSEKRMGQDLDFSTFYPKLFNQADLEHPQRLFCSQLFLQNRVSSRRSNQSKQSKQSKGMTSRKQMQFEGQGKQKQGLFQSQQFLNRSWAYSSSQLQQGNSLFNSNNFDLKNSNFHPFRNI